MGRPVCRAPGRGDGGDQRLDRLRPQARRPGHRRLRRPTSPCSPRQGIVEAADAEAIAKGLAQVKGEIEAGTFSFKRALEDIHMNVESRLAEIVGPAAGRLHTARSRNDQVAVDFRLWVRDAIDAILVQIAQLQRALAARALESAGNGHAGLHPSAIGAAGHLRPSSHGLCRDAGARRGALQGRAQAPQRMSARRARRSPEPRSRSTAT